MTDYTWTIGTGDVMMIRDTGTNVEFWFHSDTGTFNHEQNFAYTINGHTVAGQFDLLADGAWRRLGYENVTTDQTVSFTMYDEGIGWPTTTHTVAIDRAAAPAAPKPPVLTVRSDTVIELDLGADGANNGAGIDSRQYSGSGSAGGVGAGARAASNNYQWSGLAPGTKYYFWERTHNAKGYSPWSAVASATTWRVPDTPSPPTIALLKDTFVVQASFTPGGNGGTPFLEHQFGYSRSPSVDAGAIQSSGTSTVTGFELTPGILYYMWTRSRNSVGWSAWSAMITFKMPAGARIKQGTVYKDAVPYVKVNGIWRIAKSWEKNAGVWKETA